MQQSVEQRIEGVINNLLPATALSGKFGSPKNLYERLAHYHTPGISIAVINDFEIEWARGFGVCEALSNREVTPDTLFQAASISKPVFALAVMRLVQSGSLNEGFVSLMRVYAHIGKGAIVMLNSNEVDLMPEVMRSLALEYDWPDVFEKEKAIVTLPRADLYSGLYLTKSGLQFKVVSRDGNLFLQCGQQPPLQFFPTSELEFFAKLVNTSISFEKDDAGNITAMMLSQAGVTSLRPQADKQIRAERQA